MDAFSRRIVGWAASDALGGLRPADQSAQQGSRSDQCRPRDVVRHSDQVHAVLHGRSASEHGCRAAGIRPTFHGLEGSAYLAGRWTPYAARFLAGPWRLRMLRTELDPRCAQHGDLPAPSRGVIHHSRPSGSGTLIAFDSCKAAGIRPSMGSVGDCFDNALCAKLFATLECELLERRRFKDPEPEARLAQALQLASPVLRPPASLHANQARCPRSKVFQKSPAFELQTSQSRQSPSPPNATETRRFAISTPTTVLLVFILWTLRFACEDFSIFHFGTLMPSAREGPPPNSLSPPMSYPRSEVEGVHTISPFVVFGTLLASRAGAGQRGLSA